MKKILSCVMALSIAACAAMSASAVQEVDQDKYENTKPEVIATYNAGNAAFVVSIPDAITVNELSTPTSGDTVSITGVKVENGKSIDVTVSSANSWKLKQGSDEINYDLTFNGSSIKSDGKVIENATENVESNNELSITATGSPIYAGDYTDTLTFTVAYGA